jgi:hypothetical protein
MIYEMRVYTLQPGKVPEFQGLIEREALPVINKYSKTSTQSWSDGGRRRSVH